MDRNKVSNYDKNQAAIILSRINQDKKLGKKAKKLEEKFAIKPKLEADKSLRGLAIIGKFMFSVISITLAFYFVSTLFFEAIAQLEISLVLSFILLSFIEFLKHITLPKIVNNFLVTNQEIRIRVQTDLLFKHSEEHKALKSQKIKAPFLIFNIILVCLSVYLSVKGIALYNEEKLAVKPSLIQVDSLNRIYDTKIKELQKMYTKQIQSVQSELSEFRNSISWKGKINMYNEANRKIMADYSTRLNQLQTTLSENLGQLRSEKAQVIQKAENTNQARLKTAENETKANAWHLIIFASFSEIGCIICLYFLCLSDFKAYQEIQKANSLIVKPKRSHTSKKLETLAAPTSEKPNPQVDKPIAKTEKQRKILELYHEKNLRKMEIHRLTGVSRTTIDKVINTYSL